MVEPKDIRVLIACEESQSECKAFRRLGFTAFSCDLQPCSGGMPEYHIVGDARKVMLDNWDLIIAHPPCTYLTKAQGNLMFPDKKLDCARFVEGVKGALFFLEMLNAPAQFVAVENPTPLLIYGLPRYNCVVQPYEFGAKWSKRTCLWLKNLPPLIPTCYATQIKSYVRCTSGSKKRSKSFDEISAAMANQWGNFILDEMNRKKVITNDDEPTPL